MIDVFPLLSKPSRQAGYHCLLALLVVAYDEGKAECYLSASITQINFIDDDDDCAKFTASSSLSHCLHTAQFHVSALARQNHHQSG